MITIDGYSIQEYPKQNKIVISLPPTSATCVNTLNEEEQAAILSIVNALYKKSLKEQKNG